MKRNAFFTVLFLSILITDLIAVGFSSYSMFYGIGQQSYSGQWGFSETYNNFSGQCLDTLCTDTQVWILHHPVHVYIDSCDTVIDLNYYYRYYSEGSIDTAWKELHPDRGGKNKSYTGEWYVYYTLDYVPLFNLPLDTGKIYLEFKIDATVIERSGDTLQMNYRLPDGQEFKAYFVSISKEVSGSEPVTAVELDTFGILCSPAGVSLHWKTASETENSHFLIYRDDKIIGRMDGNGTTTEQHSYAFLDTRVPAGIHSYAIADVTYGGVEELHDAVVVEVGAEIVEADFILNIAYPNPFNPSTVISMQYAVGSHSVVNIYNTQGVLVDQLINGFIEAGRHEVTWDASNMPSGVYIVKMIVGDVVQSQKLVLLK